MALSHHMMYLNCPLRFTPMTFIERLALMLPRAFHHHVLRDHCVRRTCLKSFRSADQPFFAAVDPVAVFIHHDVLHLSSFNCSTRSSDVVIEILENPSNCSAPIESSSLTGSSNEHFSITCIHVTESTSVLVDLQAPDLKCVAFQVFIASPSPPGWNPDIVEFISTLPVDALSVKIRSIDHCVS